MFVVFVVLCFPPSTCSFLRRRRRRFHSQSSSHLHPIPSHLHLTSSHLHSFLTWTLQLRYPAEAALSYTDTSATSTSTTPSMAAELTSLVAQQLIDTRPSPGLEIQNQLSWSDSPFPSPTVSNSVITKNNPPTTSSFPIAPLPKRAGTFTDKPHSPNPPSTSPSSSPKGANDIFSLASDRQLADKYKFLDEIGFGNWVGRHSLLHRFIKDNPKAIVENVSTLFNRAPSGKYSRKQDRQVVR